MIANNSETFSPSRITQLIKDANQWAGTTFFWPSLARARVTSALKNTQSLNYDYYDYPSDFITDSVARLYIDGQKYEKKAFYDFLDYVDQTQLGATRPDPTKYYYADFGRQYFVWPSYAGSGTNNLIVWGYIQPPDLVDPETTTIFSKWDDSGNEAIVCKAVSVAMERLDSGMSAQNIQKATGLLQTLWSRVTRQMQRSQRLNHPFFVVPDLFNANNGQASIGNFNVVTQGGY